MLLSLEKTMKASAQIFRDTLSLTCRRPLRQLDLKPFRSEPERFRVFRSVLFRQLPFPPVSKRPPCR
jgi:hypothetical protein